MFRIITKASSFRGESLVSLLACLVISTVNNNDEFLCSPVFVFCAAAGNKNKNVTPNAGFYIFGLF